MLQLFDYYIFNMEYRISTITAIAKINSLINLEELYNIIKVDDKQNLYYDNNDNIILHLPIKLDDIDKNNNLDNLDDFDNQKQESNNYDYLSDKLKNIKNSTISNQPKKLK